MPTDALLATLTILAVLQLALLLLLWFRRPPPPQPPPEILQRLDSLAQALRDTASTARADNDRLGAGLRNEVGQRLDQGFTAIVERLDATRRDSAAQVDNLRTVVHENLDRTRAESRAGQQDATSAVRTALSDARQDQARSLAELTARLDRLAAQSTADATALREAVEARLREARDSTDAALARTRSELSDASAAARTDTRSQFADFQKATVAALAESRSAQASHLADFAQRLGQLQETVGTQLERARSTVDARLAELATLNAARLEEIRQTVDQRLQATLEQRLGESFKIVSDNLERVIRSLGEMQQMAASVGDLRRVLTNVKTRGTWGEVQLGLLLAEMLTPDQYAANVTPRPDSREVVEFAIRLPGRDASQGQVWLPIDAKFPVEDYERLTAAAEQADAAGVADASRALAARVRDQARTIAEKYVAPPYTTDFALLFLPSEGLYAEVLRQPGLASEIQHRHRVTLAGPTTLAALLNSLQLGFRSLAIEQRASEVWQVLGAVKTEFGKFGDTLDKVKKKLEGATRDLEHTDVRTRAIQRRLRDVEALPAHDAARLLPDVESDGSADFSQA